MASPPAFSHKAPQVMTPRSICQPLLAAWWGPSVPRSTSPPASCLLGERLGVPQLSTRKGHLLHRVPPMYSLVQLLMDLEVRRISVNVKTVYCFQPSTLAMGFHLKFAQKQLFYKIKFETWIRPVLNLPADSEGEIKTGPNISLHTVFDLFLDQRCHWVWYIMYVFWFLKLLTNLKKCL